MFSCVKNHRFSIKADYEFFGMFDQAEVIKIKNTLTDLNEIKY